MITHVKVNYYLWQKAETCRVFSVADKQKIRWSNYSNIDFLKSLTACFQPTEVA